jgi:hypothetical protein
MYATLVQATQSNNLLMDISVGTAIDDSVDLDDVPTRAAYAHKIATELLEAREHQVATILAYIDVRLEKTHDPSY